MQRAQTIVGTYPVGRAPDAVAFDGKYIWVANSNSAQVWILNPETGQMVNGYSTGVFPTDMVYDGTNIWVSNGFRASLGLGSVTEDTGGRRRIRRNIYHTRHAAAGTGVRRQVHLGMQLAIRTRSLACARRTWL